jgi:alpha-glucosidase
VLALEREAGGDRRRVVVNFTSDPARYQPDGQWVVEVATDGGGEGRPFDGTLGPDATCLLRPAG